MARFIELKNNVVVNTIIAEQEFVDTLPNSENYRLVNNEDVSIGWTLETDNLYYPPKPYPSWIWNSTENWWEAPVALPEDNMACTDEHCKCSVWNEATQTWDRLHRTKETTWTFDE